MPNGSAFCPVDFRGEVFAISKWTGQKAKDVKARLGNANTLPSVDEAKARIAERMTDTIRAFIKESEVALKADTGSVAVQKRELVQWQRYDRDRLKDFHEKSQQRETQQHAA